MKKVLAFILFTAAVSAYSADFKFSGTLDTSLYMAAGRDDAPAFIAGFEEFANLRAQARIGDAAAFYGALNLIALSGSYAEDLQTLNEARKTEGGFQPSAWVSGDNYASGIELERLYFALNSDYLGFNAGLKRLAFGYGNVFGPTDFLNPKNPLFPDARPRATLGGDLAFFPDGDSRLLAFAAAPRNPVDSAGRGTMAGIEAERHWERLSLQNLYVYESPTDGAGQGVHRFGLSAKADAVLGFVFDALYTFDRERSAETGFDGSEGLSASAGADYSFSISTNTIYLLTEYLFSGVRSSTSTYGGNLSGFPERHYLYSLVRWGFDDYTSLSLACLAEPVCAGDGTFDDDSFIPIVGFQCDIIQGLTLDITAQFPRVDRYFTLTSRLRLRL